MKPSRFHTATDAEIRAGKTTDVYFTRAEAVLRRKGLWQTRAVAEFSASTLPKQWPWGIFCGLEEAAALLEGVPVNVWALEEGTLFPARDAAGMRVPVLVIEGSYGAFCLRETPLLGFLCQATGIATQAARIRLAAGKAQVLGFGIRRMHPAVAPMIDRASFIGGCDGVSCVLGAERLGEAPKGTMPHALMLIHGEGQAAWKAYDEVLPAEVPRVALVDTFSDEKREALKAAELLGKRLKGIRLDTPESRRGDMADLVREVRWELDLRGFRHVGIFVSGGVGEEQIPALIAAGAGGFGVGTAIANAPTVNFAMDLVEVAGKPLAKRGKCAGRKAVRRCVGCGRVWVLPERGRGGKPSGSCGVCGKATRPLLQPLLKAGRRVGRPPKPAEIRRRVLKQLNALTSGH